jgi:hypothetical protein
MRRVSCLLLAIGATAMFAGCSGRTTGASEIGAQPNGSYAATLHAVGSCEKGSSRTPCIVYMRWREGGTEGWTRGPSTEVGGKVSDHPFSQTATGLSPDTNYEYQVCGKEFADKQVACVGPDGKRGSAQEFVTGNPGAGGQKGGGENGSATGGQPEQANQQQPEQANQQQPEQANGNQATQANGGQLAASSAAGKAGGGSNNCADGGGTSLWVPIAIAAGALLLIGVAWWTRKEAYW